MLLCPFQNVPTTRQIFCYVNLSNVKHTKTKCCASFNLIKKNVSPTVKLKTIGSFDVFNYINPKLNSQ